MLKFVVYIVWREKVMSEATQAKRFNKGKLRWSLIDYKSIIPLVEALEYGANKYSRDNWKKGLIEHEILDSIQRHFVELVNGNDFDDESGVRHEGHIMANLMFLLYQKLNKKVKDNE